MVLEMTRKIFNEPTFIKDVSEYGQILLVQFAPFEWCQDLLLIVFQDKILLAQLQLTEILQVEILTEFSHPNRCTAISVSPQTSLLSLPHQLHFVAAGNDFKLRLYDSNLNNQNTCKVLIGHSSYINDVNFDPDNKYFASTGDDHAVKVWYADGTYKTSFDLTSPGISVCWQREDTCELLAAEKIGIIRFFNVESESPVLSLDYTKPLCSAHWAPYDRDLVASLHSGELLIWELTKPCLPQQHNVFFNENGGNIKFSPQGELVAAVNSLDSSMKIIHVKSQTVKLTASVALPTNVTWHYRYPLVCLGDDYRLCFWKTA
nr:unnamed protein product [Callosobruchus chinensis]